MSRHVTVQVELDLDEVQTESIIEEINRRISSNRYKSDAQEIREMCEEILGFPKIPNANGRERTLEDEEKMKILVEICNKTSIAKLTEISQSL